MLDKDDARLNMANIKNKNSYFLELPLLAKVPQQDCSIIHLLTRCIQLNASCLLCFQERVTRNREMKNVLKLVYLKLFKP